MNQEAIEEQEAKQRRRAELEALEPITFPELKEVFNKWMLIPDPYFLKYVLSCYCANALSQRPVWTIIVAPSGGGKTEMLNSLLPLEMIYPLSTLTTNTFLSGMPGAKDQSLLPQLNDKILLVKDWTVILSMQKDAKAELFGQFRDIHDGAMTKAFGNGQNRTWTGKVSILAACTEEVDRNQQQHTHLGERFVFYRPLMPDRHEVARRSLQNSAKQQEMGVALQNAIYAFVKGVNFADYESLPELPGKAQEELVDLAEFATKARSGVIRDFGFKKDVLFVPTPEMPTRVLQQVALVGQGAMIVNGGGLSDRDMEMMYKVMLDSVPLTNMMVIKEMARGDSQTTAAIASALGYPTETIRTYLENQALLGVCVREKGKQADRWKLNKKYAEIIRRYYDVDLLPDPAEKSEVVEAVEEVFEQPVRNPYKEPDYMEGMI